MLLRHTAGQAARGAPRPCCSQWPAGRGEHDGSRETLLAPVNVLVGYSQSQFVEPQYILGRFAVKLDFRGSQCRKLLQYLEKMVFFLLPFTLLVYLCLSSVMFIC